MKHGEQIKVIRLAYEEFATQHKGQTMSKKEIEDGVQRLLDFDVNGELCVSDFAEPETLQERSKLNKTLFKRTDTDGIYIILGK